MPQPEAQALFPGPGCACVAIDFETSGHSGRDACAIGLARLEQGRVVERFARLIRPPSPRVYFTHIHGLRWSDLKDQPGFAEVWGEARALLHGARYLIAHNARFDRGVLLACCQAFGVVGPDLPFLCTLKGARRGLRLPSNRLNCVCAHFGIPLKHHDAGSDAEGCALVYARLRALGVTDEVMLL